MNTPIGITPLDLLRLSRDEFRRYREHAEAGGFEMFSSARLARELMLEALELLQRDHDSVNE